VTIGASLVIGIVTAIVSNLMGSLVKKKSSIGEQHVPFIN
jgi:hypothetical protein